MGRGKKRVTIDLDASLHGRLKETAAQKGVSMREYCEVAFEKELARDEAAEAIDNFAGSRGRATSVPSRQEAMRDRRGNKDPGRDSAG